MMFDFSKVLIKKHSFNNNKIHVDQYKNPETLIVNGMDIEKFVVSIKHLLEIFTCRHDLSSKFQILNFQF